MAFPKPQYFLMDAANKRIIVCGEDEHEAHWIRAKLGLCLTASIYCGLTQYNLSTLTDWTTHSGHVLIEKTEN